MPRKSKKSKEPPKKNIEAPSALPKQSSQKSASTPKLSPTIFGVNVSSWVNLGTWLHNAFTLFIAIVDVVSDILVALQFYDEGNDAWGHLVSASILLSSIVLASFAATDVRDSRKFDHTASWAKSLVHAYQALAGWHVFIRFLVFLPIAQLLPIISWVLEVADRATHEERYRYDLPLPEKEDATMGERQASDAINADDEASRATSTAVMDSFQAGFKRHVEEHAMFYIETCVESIPQCIIQLLAMTFLQEATPLQLLSMMLSLISIVSKGYLISFSFDFRTFIWRFALAAHDLLSLFYVFSTLMSPTEPQEWVLPEWMGGLSMSWLSWLVCWKLTIAAVVLLCSGVFLALSVAVTCLFFEKDRSVCAKDIGEFCAVTGVALVCFVPAVIAAEGVKLASISLFIASQNSTKQENAPAMAKLFNFIMDAPTQPAMVNHNGSDEDIALRQPMEADNGHNDTFMGRYRFVLYQFATSCECRATTYFMEHYSTSYMKTYFDEIRCTRWACRQYKDGTTEPNFVRPSEHHFTRLRDWYSDIDTLCDKYKHQLVESEKVQQLQTTSRIEKPLELFFKHSYVPPLSEWKRYREGAQHSSFIQAYLLFMLWVLFIIDIPFMIFGTLYPPLHAAYVVLYHGGTLNVLQSFCVIAALCCWVVIAMLGKRGLTYACLVLDMSHLPLYNDITRFTLADARRTLRSFFKPTNRQVLLASVPWELLPPDVLETTANFIPAAGNDAINTKSVSLRHVTALKAKLE